MQMFILWHNLFCKDSSIFRSFKSLFHRNFVSLGDFSIDHANFLRKCFEFSKKDREISFEILLKICENKGRISTKFALITFAQYCISAIASSKRSIQSTPFHILKNSEPNLCKEYDSRHKFSKKWSLSLF